MNRDSMITIPLRKRDFDLANRWKQKYEHPQKQEQIYLNTLARCAVSAYFQYLAIESDLADRIAQNQSNDDFTHYFMDIADLNLKGFGKIECRAVLPNAEVCYIPQEVWQDRIGYFVTEIDAQEWEANLLGFVKQVSTEYLPLHQIQSLEEAIDHLYQVKEVEADHPLVKLCEWFQQIFENGWQPEEVALTLALNPTRSIKPNHQGIEQPEVNGAKVIRLGVQMHQETVILIIRQKQLSEAEIQINVRLYPAADAMYLPDGVQLTVLDETGTPIPKLQVQARAANWLKLEFTGEPKDQFSIRVSLEESSVTEHFLL
ncbi:DUF1822 family protein [Roseofilum capinflatum]|uniref:DUF1822 family protein n=1 Tax=Roseofilum capinflatum BLCC-M114 TaxID=3022440 RepID=A0ABT7B9W4_9CYAN|nr:DUF1822 family protein [Roseofilum capinflatum]MDJ1175968.1 DUF1822 family protein [Roseofilum capinflatum BLCC-M114]